jgi:PEP-CTERM motif-containing protein
MRRFSITTACVLVLSVVMTRWAMADDIFDWSGVLLAPDDPNIQAAVGEFPSLFFDFQALGSILIFPGQTFPTFIIDSGAYNFSSSSSCVECQVSDFQFYTGGIFATITAPNGYQWTDGGLFSLPHPIFGPGTYIISGKPIGGGGVVTITDLGPTPEPSTLVLFAIGLAMLALRFNYSRLFAGLPCRTT